MKYLLTAFFCFTFLSGFSQNPEKVEFLNFCGKQFKVPAGYQAKSAYELSGPEYAMTWVYLPQDQLATYPEQTLSLLASRMENFTKTSISGYLLSTPAQGYKISYTSTSGLAHQIIAYGQVNGQAVMVQLFLHQKPTSNTDIPAFPKQIVRFTK